MLNRIQSSLILSLSYCCHLYFIIPNFILKKLFPLFFIKVHSKIGTWGPEIVTNYSKSKHLRHSTTASMQFGIYFSKSLECYRGKENHSFKRYSFYRLTSNRLVKMSCGHLIGLRSTDCKYHSMKFILLCLMSS